MLHLSESSDNVNLDDDGDNSDNTKEDVNKSGDASKDNYVLTYTIDNSIPFSSAVAPHSCQTTSIPVRQSAIFLKHE